MSRVKILILFQEAVLLKESTEHFDITREP